jgi:hypothetical protein
MRVSAKEPLIAIFCFALVQSPEKLLPSEKSKSKTQFRRVRLGLNMGIYSQYASSVSAFAYDRAIERDRNKTQNSEALNF